MSTSGGGSNPELLGPGGGEEGRVVSSTSAANAAGVGNTASPYIRLSSLSVPVNQQQQQSLHTHVTSHSQIQHPIYQKVVDPNGVLLASSSSHNNKPPLQKTIGEDSNVSGNNKSVAKDVPTPFHEFQDNEPYVVTVRNSPARSFSKTQSGSNIPPSPTASARPAVPSSGLKVFSGKPPGPRLALYRSNSSLDLLDRDNYLNNQARAFHHPNFYLHSHAHQVSSSPHFGPQQRLSSSASVTAVQNIHQNPVHNDESGLVSPTTGCFTRRKDYGSHGSIDMLAGQQQSVSGFMSSGGVGGHTVRSGSVGTGSTRPFLSLMSTSGIQLDSVKGNRNSRTDHTDGGVSGFDESKSLPASATKNSVANTRETASPRLRLKFQKLFENDKKDKSNASNGNDKGMGNSALSTSTLSSNTTSSSKSEASIFRKFRSVSSTSRQQASKSLPEANKFDTTAVTVAGSESGDILSSTAKVVLRHPGPNPMEERYRRRALAHYDCQSISANISYAARLRGLLSKRRNTTTGASAASLGQRSPPENNSGISGNSTINGGISPSSSGPSLSSLTKQSSSHAGGSSCNISSSSGSTNNLLQVPGQQQDTDLGDGKSNANVLSCPYFRNEVGGEQERIVSLTRLARTNSVAMKSVTGYRKVGIYGKATEDLDVIGQGPFVSPLEEATHRSTSCRNLARLEYRNGSVSHWNQGICPYASLSNRQHMLEAVDVGASYYREYFYKQDHENWFGLDENLGPLAISIRKERIDNQLYSNVISQSEGKSSTHGSGNCKYLYRLIVRSTELNTIRGSILEDSIPGIKLNSSKDKIHAKDVIEFLLPEIQLSCLKLGTQTTQTEDQLLKLDEQVLTSRHKVGIMYCKAGQSTEEEMYNNESAGPAFNEFLDLIGTRIRLKGFDKYTGGLDNKDDSTGLHSVYAQYENCEVIFHVSTLLPFTPNNRQQLMRKRHIGNDIVTIVFQEPGALPFTPKNIRSQFQHVFIVVRAINPCTDSTSYSVSVSRSREVPLFGPQIPVGAKFPKSQDFVEFLMAKVINAENATYRSEKFTTMATRTRQEYLKDLVANFTTSTTIDPQRKFSIKAFGGSKKKDFSKPVRFIGDSILQGALSWSVYLEDVYKGCKVDAFFGVSCDSIVIIDAATREVVFAISTSSVLGWNRSIINCLKLYYHQGECVTIFGKDSPTLGESDLQEIRTRLECVTRGCETIEYTLGRNDEGQLGFHVQQDGVVTEIETAGSASMVGMKQGSRLVEICKVSVATLTQDQMIDLLKNSNPVTVLVIPPSIGSAVRRGCDSKHCLFTLESDAEFETSSHLKNGVREDGESSYSTKSPHPHFKSSAIVSHRKRYEPRSFSPPRSSNSSGYGTGSSSKSFSSGNGDTLHHISPHNEGGPSTGSSSGGLSSEDKWYDLNDNLKESQFGTDARSTPPPVPARAPTGNSPASSIPHNNNNVNKINNINGTPVRDPRGNQVIDVSGFPGYRGDSLKHSMSMNNGASPAVSSLLDRNFLGKRDYFQRSSPHHGSFHSKLSPSRSHDMLHLKNFYGLNQLRPFPGSSVGLDQTPTHDVGASRTQISRSTYLTPQGRLTREKSSLGTPTRNTNTYGITVPENTIRGKMTYLTDFPLTHSCSSEQIQNVGVRKDDLNALKNERLAAIKQAYQEKNKDRERRFKKESSPSPLLNGYEKRDSRESSSPDDDIISKPINRPSSLNIQQRLPLTSTPKATAEVKLRNSSQSARNNLNRSSTLQEDLIRLISPEYISEGLSSENGMETSEDNSPDSDPAITSAPALFPNRHPVPLPVQQLNPAVRCAVGADAPSSELYSMRLSSASPKYINPQRQSWSTNDSGDERKSYQHSTGASTPSLDPDMPLSASSTPMGYRSKSPVKASYSSNLYNDPRTPIASSVHTPNGNFRVTPAVSVGHWVKDDMKTPSSSDDGERSTGSPVVPIENVFNLEARVSQLEAELRKEQQSKQVLAATVANLQEENRRLQEESHSTQDQFIKFKQWLMHTVEGQGENDEEDC